MSFRVDSISTRYSCIVMRRPLNLAWQIPLALVVMLGLLMLEAFLGSWYWPVGLLLLGGFWLVVLLLKRRRPKRILSPSFLDWSVNLPKRVLDRGERDRELCDEESLELFRIMSMIRGDSLPEIQAKERKAWGRTFEDDVAAGRTKAMVVTNPASGELWDAYGPVDGITKPSSAP